MSCPLCSQSSYPGADISGSRNPALEAEGQHQDQDPRRDGDIQHFGLDWAVIDRRLRRDVGSYTEAKYGNQLETFWRLIEVSMRDFLDLAAMTATTKILSATAIRSISMPFFEIFECEGFKVETNVFQALLSVAQWNGGAAQSSTAQHSTNRNASN
jgi:hypothetical protein